MKSVLGELWYGNICPNTDCYELKKETRELTDYIVRHSQDLWSTLTDKQKEIFEKLEDCHSELVDINEREIFVYAFRLGARVAIEVMTLGNEGEI